MTYRLQDIKVHVSNNYHFYCVGRGGGYIFIYSLVKSIPWFPFISQTILFVKICVLKCGLAI